MCCRRAAAACCCCWDGSSRDAWCLCVFTADVWTRDFYSDAFKFVLLLLKAVWSLETTRSAARLGHAFNCPARNCIVIFTSQQTVIASSLAQIDSMLAHHKALRASRPHTGTQIVASPCRINTSRIQRARTALLARASAGDGMQVFSPSKVSAWDAAQGRL